LNFRNEQRQWLKIRTKKIENSNNSEGGNPETGGRSDANIEIITYQKFTKDRLIKFARMHGNID